MSENIFKDRDTGYCSSNGKAIIIAMETRSGFFYKDFLNLRAYKTARLTNCFRINKTIEITAKQTQTKIIAHR